MEAWLLLEIPTEQLLGCDAPSNAVLVALSKLRSLSVLTAKIRDRQCIQYVLTPFLIIS
jgi:hypothetical protein